MSGQQQNFFTNKRKTGVREIPATTMSFLNLMTSGTVKWCSGPLPKDREYIFFQFPSLLESMLNFEVRHSPHRSSVGPKQILQSPVPHDYPWLTVLFDFWLSFLPLWAREVEGERAAITRVQRFLPDHMFPDKKLPIMSWFEDFSFSNIHVETNRARTALGAE